MRKLNLVASCVAIGALALSAVAQDAPPPRRGGGEGGDRQPGGQPGGGAPRGTQLTPEKAKAAWDLEATGVAKRIGLTEEQTKAVIKAYAEARTSHAAAAQKLRDKMRDAGGGGDDGGDRRERMQAIQKETEEMNKAEREKLQKALAAAVSADQAGKAVASLGTFAPGWDRMADAIGEFKLEAKKQQDALNAVEDFIVAQSKMTRGGDPQDAQDARREARQKLLAALKPILSEEQMAKFEQSTGGGGRRGGGGGGDGGGRGGGGGGGF